MPDLRVPPEENIICRCHLVTEYVLTRTIRSKKLRTVEQVMAATRAGTGCSSCTGDIQDLLDRLWGPISRPSATEPSAPPALLPHLQKRDRILAALQGALRPMLELNALEVHLVDIDRNRVLVRLRGPAVGSTLPSFLALKRHLVHVFSSVCSEPMVLVELNVLESRPSPPSPS